MVLSRSCFVVLKLGTGLLTLGLVAVLRALAGLAAAIPSNGIIGCQLRAASPSVT